ncbi:hypothetical protein CAPTEDRAFT_138137, partial [Capitella teleta]
GDQAFQHAAPTLWNALPPAMRTLSDVNVLKKGLKTFYFDRLTQTIDDFINTSSYCFYYFCGLKSCSFCF